MTQIAFFLMTKKGLDVLSSVLRDCQANNVECVVGAKDTNVENDYYNEIKELCHKNGLRFYDKKEKVKIQSEYVIAVSWRWIIPKTNFQLIVIHDSLLPKYRGFAPLVSALINGEQEIGVTALFAEKEYDEGNIILQSSVQVEYPVKINNAIDLISVCYREISSTLCKNILEGGTLSSTPQDEMLATYCLWRDEEDYQIDWDQDSAIIKRFIDSTGYPYKGASSLMNQTLIRILDAETLPDVKIENRVSGKVIFTKDGFPVVVCGKGLLKITKAIVNDTAESIIPLKKFRSRFS
jgi:methionyl-tRNA formyltransferase